MKVFLTGGGSGGHLYPALNIAHALMAADPSVSPHYIGARRGIEHDVLPSTGIPFTLLDLHPLYRRRPLENIRTARGLWSAWRGIGEIAGKERPRLVIATGGYAAGAALAWAASHRVPFVLQEQNSFPGITVRAFSRMASAIYLGFPEASAWLPARARARCVDTGNPIAPPPPTEQRPDRRGARARWGFPDDPDAGPVVLIFGGSQGSAALNAVVDAWIERGLPPGLHVLWATGRSHVERHAARAGERVRVVPYLSPIGDAYAATDLAITRAGAMTTAELAAWGIPALLVPLPTAAADHQSANARALEAADAARVIRQSELTVDTLEGVVVGLVRDPSARAILAAGMRERARPDAAQTIARLILEASYLKQHGR
ncbi:MAG TPA: UDP-N-acetylglucosamine--N-acetylmuramyl-(pentapeptide) pyrophosphoryl-undecaprenol N-acetylglucosamine transferase [Gemmatimonadaceae bacterium]|nr:UDP-N-acetylglucosamine--N-acetylmuramyl-(pentapeptide) pyrophosphoryl-undecaprenol N-acetylglucosamine transferase [Gemmatimonadaceae bacterium]